MAAIRAPMIVIVGQTASGKSALALELAQKFNGEIIAADSRTVYRGMNIGTAKPPIEEQQLVPHHLLDVVEPDQRFTAADFKRLALEAIEDITARGKLPVMVGGTGLYIDSVLFDYSFADKNAARNPANPRHLKKDSAVQRGGLRPHTLIIGLDLDKEALTERINGRVELMVQKGLQQEVDQLVRRYGWEAPGLNAIGYQEWREKAKSTHEIVAEIISDTKNYAKRQKTWFKRNKSIQWVSKQSKAVEIATTFLYKN